MKKIIILIIVLLMITGCKQDKMKDDFLNEANFIEQHALYLLSSNDYNTNILYLNGYINGSKDIELLNEYFNTNVSKIQLINKNGDKVDIKSFEWHFRDENKMATFDLLLFTKNVVLLPQVFSYIQVIDEITEKEFYIGNYQIYINETSPNKSIMTSFSPFAFETAPVYDEPFTVSYDIRINPKTDFNDIHFSIDLPDSYKDLKINNISSSYDEVKTKEHISSSPGITKNPDAYKNLKVYTVDITYKQMIKGNIQIQPLIIAQTDKEKFKCKPATPFSISYENYDNKK